MTKAKVTNKRNYRRLSSGERLRVQHIIAREAATIDGMKIGEAYELIQGECDGTPFSRAVFKSLITDVNKALDINITLKSDRVGNIYASLMHDVAEIRDRLTALETAFEKERNQ